MSENVTLVPYQGTLFVSNPVANIHVTIYAESPARALEILDRFGRWAKYPVLGSRIDSAMILDDVFMSELEDGKHDGLRSGSSEPDKELKEDE